MTKYYEEVPLSYPNSSLDSSKNIDCSRDNWIANKNGDKYIISYISGEFAGREKNLEVTQEDYFNLINGQITFDGLCVKYNIS